jgi:hypothetical protein
VADRKNPYAVFAPWMVKRPKGGCLVLFPLNELDALVDEAIEQSELAVAASKAMALATQRLDEVVILQARVATLEAENGALKTKARNVRESLFGVRYPGCHDEGEGGSR